LSNFLFKLSYLNNYVIVYIAINSYSTIMLHNIENKVLARKLREKGYSYSEIKEKINVSKSTLSLWLRDIHLSQENIARLTGLQKSRLTAAESKKKRRIAQTKKILSTSIRETDELIDNPLFISGLMLYWAEGAKYSENIAFSNSDPLMIRLIMNWFRQICKVPEDKFRAEIHIHELHVRKNCEQYWSKITNIPINQFYKTQIKPTSLRFRKNRLYDGTCSIRINDVNLFRRIMGWRMGVLNKLKLEYKYQIPAITYFKIK